MNQGILVAIIPAITWLVADLTKMSMAGYNRHRLGVQTKAPHANNWVMPSGGMPSSHSAVVSSLATTVACIEGMTSVSFGIAVWFAIIVVYDAVTVRYSSGQQGIAIVELIKEQKSHVKKPVVAQGHTLVEAAAGVALGIIVALVVFFATRFL